MLAISDQKMFEVIKIQNFPKTSVELFPTKRDKKILCFNKMVEELTGVQI